MKNYTMEEIAKNLQDNLNENGELLSDGDRKDVDEVFESRVFEEVICEELGIGVTEDDDDKHKSIIEMDDIYRSEDMKYEHFHNIVEDLTEQVNEWIAGFDCSR